MEFRNYLEVREFYNSTKGYLWEGQLQCMIDTLWEFHEHSLSRNERDLILELLEDIQAELPIPKRVRTKRQSSEIEPSKVVSITIKENEPRNIIKEVEMEAIRLALVKTNGNKEEATKLLGICIRTLRNKLNEYRRDGESK